MPGPAEVRGHDGQPGMGGGHRVELQGVGVVQPDAPPVQLYFKRARSSEVLLGGPAYHRELLARHLAL
jgi:hypothetical protein